MKRSTDPRHLARVLALQELFTYYFQNDNLTTEEIPVEELVDINNIEEYNEELYSKLVSGVKEQKDTLDEIISKHAPQWSIQQMKLVDLLILRIAVLEAFILGITPPKVAIDEAIETAKEFGGEVSSKFVNGVLGAVYEERKENEEK
ncbi:MAG: transcription antitermination factor NusB [Candidatus Dojkabacteria bacterium]|jgi:N utilization substance protein B